MHFWTYEDKFSILSSFAAWYDDLSRVGPNQGIEGAIAFMLPENIREVASE